jgi:hypothetical protein
MLYPPGHMGKSRFPGGMSYDPLRIISQNWAGLGIFCDPAEWSALIKEAHLGNPPIDGPDNSFQINLTSDDAPIYHSQQGDEP